VLLTRPTFRFVMTTNVSFLCTAWIARLPHRARSVTKVLLPVGVARQFALLTQTYNVLYEEKMTVLGA
jgi:hypothetical protein